ncbi:hypothetical protein VDG04_00260 [Xanthomonas campestris pv. raphani]|nr:hypothetical protein [Xanthomonas campestris pv. raphani]
MAAVADALSDLQAARVAQGVMLEAMLASHPDPELLTQCWDRLSSSLTATAAQRKAAGSSKAVEAQTLEQLGHGINTSSFVFPEAREHR